MGIKADPTRGRIQKYVADKLRELKQTKQPQWLTLHGCRVKIVEDNATPCYTGTQYLIAFDGDYYLGDFYEKDRGLIVCFNSNGETNYIPDVTKMKSVKFLAIIEECHK